MKITKIFSFDSSHMLDGHDGKCQNLHGHTYKLEITVSDGLIQGGAKDGMVMDFTDLKAIVKQEIIDPFDHAFIYDGSNERESQIAALLDGWNMKILRLNYRTTAENMSMEMFTRLKQAGLKVCSVKLWETPTSCAEYEGA
ncbi:6-carboxytetrahydropterin synthase QueD [Neisseria sp. N95_16]|uniref:6-carboxy-5,6,7,8-tetrahydropterin synthase n=1 Tax=Neisseria brasiliensis TaxID=2666100 RepID=A0A5Q3S3W7_9NEIS|nr:MULTISPECIES: 6-carboxytetrahydropterin synthase QueD [Neisseria]MRN38411.1 6-carboxytetrahydropterin synthase QueD [Neisseria brasiliensis]PJO09745.1 6-carboxytetrahydropterin synthase QueD [Neisseria sp. N95_16]PJO78671.1 6-carboxytetrahydropterin synthase QueD [Neisseria sp. N177_16]QGL25408.1 6-carboxytetrahydropterin synthase QueD [Neisseria brasiliensis]